MSSSRSKPGPSADTGQSSVSIPRTHSRNAAKEARRIRGEIACAECRRLKIKCDRKVPCSSCVARGCAVVCPNDVLPPGDNSRHLNSATDHLQQKITKMEGRIRLLEDAVQVAQMEQSSLPHPLLRTPFVLNPMDSSDPDEDMSEDIGELADVMGSLHINEKDKSVQFYGPTGGTEARSKRSAKYMAVKDHNHTHMALRALGLPQELDIFFVSFPFTPMGIPRRPVRLTIEALLPLRERAEELSEIFMKHLSWMFQIVTLGFLRKHLIPLVYRCDQEDSRRDGDYSPHELALLLIVLAIGALVDTTQQAYNSEAQRYAALARTAAALQPIMENISLASVKFIHLLSIYNGMCGKESAVPNTYALTNLAGIMAQKVHMDPSVWKMDEKTCYERRTYFWSLLQADVLMCLSSGRPPAISNSGIHVRIPTEMEEQKHQVGENEIGFGIWGFTITRDCLLPLARHINSTTPPTYQSVLDLENKFRSYFHESSPLADAQVPVAASMQAWVRSHYQELILLFLHRAFFAKALATHPDNPLNSPYAHSLRVAYRCACLLVKVTRHQYALFPQLISRVWQIWTFAFTSAIMVGAVANRMHQLDLDPPPLQTFDKACELFKEASSTSTRAAKALVSPAKFRP
ncbi:hypothetical protein BXZ70DRAFT_895415 [Cristinia sonorae]|uniref:Zn(2)-C6 fungal-type domain-containing protein n=1 Tax=Cristinia sonorae TaxID=1940300 RepID=A0A8K0XNT3_9AGAR|nr:hypothetical protein BXZ70DRAFT_895415 [Cristinia sonorae]